MKSENENEHFNVEGNVVKSELKIEHPSDSETVICEIISATHEVTNVEKIAKSVEIRAKNEECQNENNETQIGFSVKEPKGNLDNNKENVSEVQRKNFKKKIL